MNARIRLYASRLAAALALTATLGAAFAALPADIDAPGHSADTTVPRNAPAVQPASGTTTAARPPGDVGDPDSFGRNVQWLGLADGEVDLLDDCTGDTFACQPLAAAPGVTNFTFEDLGHITLPPRAAHSLL